MDYNNIITLCEGKGNVLLTLHRLCDELAVITQARSMRIGFDGEWHCSDDFCVTDFCRPQKLAMGGDGEILFEFYFSDNKYGRYQHLVENGELAAALAIIKGWLSGLVLERLAFEHRERNKELTGINKTRALINENLPIEETLQKIVDCIPAAWQYPEKACARLRYEELTFTSPDFKETPWMMDERFVTVDNKKGVLEVFYIEEGLEFLSEEFQLISNLARLIGGYVNNTKGRALFNNIPKVASANVSEDFRKTLTHDKQPLQLFFNKQIIEKYVYLDMMKYKIKNILFVATLYDAFTLENEDSFFEQFMGEIYQYSLFSLPRITGVSSSEEALELMQTTKFDLVILMVGLDTKATIDLSRDIKLIQSDLPVYLLLNQKNNAKYFEEKATTLPTIDKVFVWGGNSQILFSIVKSIEDSANVENDTRLGLVRVILLVEDSPVYYSKYLRMLFSIVFNQVQQLLVEEERNEINKISKMRQRPKILHARNYEDAMYIFDKYKDYLLCVISDVEFDRNGKADPHAGASLVEHMLKHLPTLPVILQSADPDNRKEAEKLGVSFLDKDSDSLQSDLMEFLTSRLGFGDFIFRNHAGKPLAQAKGLREFETIFRNIPVDMLGEYCGDNRISSWLMSRGEIPLARRVNPIRFDDYADPEKFRSDLLAMMNDHREKRQRGKVLDFDEVEQLSERNVVTLADGSLGGKGRGLAFINTLILNIDTSEFDAEINIRIPITAIVGVNEFDEFMQRGNLWAYVLSNPPYLELRQRFAEVPLSDKLMERLRRFLRMIHKPVAVRSSSLSEDSLNQPFAGVFDTYLVPNNADTIEENVQNVATAIRMVYASIYSDASRTYFQTIRHKIEEEKMAVVIQVLVGSEHEGYYYPHISGTAQSYNYYPVAHMKPEEGFAVAAVGLGYYVVGGGKAFRFSPAWPNIDISSINDMVKNTQVDMLAIDLNRKQLDYVNDGEHAPVATLDITEAEKHGTLKHCLSVYNPQNDTIEVGTRAYGPRVVNFGDILKYDYIPLAKLLSMLLNAAKDAMGSPVEIEWAVDLNEDANGCPSFYLLQMKPIITELLGNATEVERPDESKAILYTEQSLGNGEVKDITDVIFCDPEIFDKMQTEEMVKEINYLNSLMLDEDRHYVLIGPGRWGTRDRFIGIPVQWANISMAKVIVEMSLPGFPLDSSLGSHFFHNVTSMNIGYLSVQDSSDRDFIAWDNLRKMPVFRKTKYFKQIRLEKPLDVKMNGKQRKAAIALNN